jgi:hypothetical protein
VASVKVRTLGIPGFLPGRTWRGLPAVGRSYTTVVGGGVLVRSLCGGARSVSNHSSVIIRRWSVETLENLESFERGAKD